MIAPTLVDTGPLVAYLNSHDRHHARCVELLNSMTGPPLVPVTVMVEVCWLVEDDPRVEAEFLEAIKAGAFKLVPVTREDLTRIAELVRQYADFPLGTVDASVVTLAERLKLREIATLDRRHFSAVRPRHVDALTLLPE